MVALQQLVPAKFVELRCLRSVPISNKSYIDKCPRDDTESFKKGSREICSLLFVYTLNKISKKLPAILYLRVFLYILRINSHLSLIFNFKCRFRTFYSLYWFYFLLKIDIKYYQNHQKDFPFFDKGLLGMYTM